MKKISIEDMKDYQGKYFDYLDAATSAIENIIHNSESLPKEIEALNFELEKTLATLDVIRSIYNGKLTGHTTDSFVTETNLLFDVTIPKLIEKAKAEVYDLLMNDLQKIDPELIDISSAFEDYDEMNFENESAVDLRLRHAATESGGLIDRCRALEAALSSFNEFDLEEVQVSKNVFINCDGLSITNKDEMFKVFLQKVSKEALAAAELKRAEEELRKAKQKVSDLKKRKASSA